MIGVLRPDEYYTPLGQGTLSSQLYEIGQFFWAPSLFLLDNNRRQAVKSSYSEGSGEQFRLDPVDLRTEFNQPGDIIHPLGIRTDERSLVIGAKRRPVIVLSQAAERWSDAQRRQDDCYLVAPVYTFSGDDTRVSYSPAFIDRVKGYVYWQFFYLPPRGNTGGNGRIRESFVRLDRIQVVHKDLLDHRPVRLSDQVMALLREWIRVYMGENLQDVNDILFDYREDATRQLSGR